MNVNPLRPPSVSAASDAAALRPAAAPDAAKDGQLRKTFDAFVGEVFFGQMLKAMRKTLDKPAYFHGGRAEELFQQQLDQVLSEKLSHASADKLSGPMFELFTLGRR